MRSSRKEEGGKRSEWLRDRLRGGRLWVGRVEGRRKGKRCRKIEEGGEGDGEDELSAVDSSLLSTFKRCI
jgi:hypothetical protein